MPPLDFECLNVAGEPLISIIIEMLVRDGEDNAKREAHLREVVKEFNEKHRIRKDRWKLYGERFEDNPIDLQGFGRPGDGASLQKHSEWHFMKIGSTGSSTRC